MQQTGKKLLQQMRKKTIAISKEHLMKQNKNMNCNIKINVYYNIQTHSPQHQGESATTMKKSYCNISSTTTAT